MNVQPFRPLATNSVAAGTTSQAVALPVQGNVLEVQNAGNVAIFITLGGSSVTSTAAAGYPVLPGQCKLISRDPNTETYLAAITAAGTAALYVTAGEGM
jgi:hypothetical protein